MYNSYQGHYNQYGAPGAAPGMAPPGVAAPGTGAPPGMQQQDAHQQGRPGGFSSTFQPPSNMPNINFAAPVIRLGTGSSRPDGQAPRDDRDRRRPGLGAGPGYEYRDRERPQPVTPQTKEEIIKTIFLGGITEGAGGDEGIERLLRAAGSLRRWFRAKDADDKPCKFGFAEYDDPESLRTAIEVLKDIQIPVKQRSAEQTNGDTKMEVEKSRLLVVADENSQSYIETWEESQGGVDTNHKQMLIDHAREAIHAVLTDLENPSSSTKDQLSTLDQDGDASMSENRNADGEVVTIPLSVDDELSDIPAEMREMVAKEIASFRDRSNRRDMERLKREEEIEQQEKGRLVNGSRNGRSSPPLSAPSGPGAANTIPVGPRGAAPSGPKALASGFAKDYQKGVTFVNGRGISAASAFEDDDTDASDEELERRRKEKKQMDEERQYNDEERRWTIRETSKSAAIEREKKRDQDEESKIQAQKDDMAERLRDWDDDVEATRKVEPYYADRSMWIRNRAVFRSREQADDDADRAADQREKARENQSRERTGAMADDFLTRQEDELSQDRPRTANADVGDTRQEPARFKLSLGAAAQKAAQANAAQQANKRTVAEVEGLLEDEEDESAESRRKIIPIQFDKNDVVRMSEEERQEAAKQLAAEIPNDKEGLWNWQVKWDFVDETLVEEKLRPFVEKKIVEYLGVQEQMLVDVAVAALRDRKTPGALVGELEGALEGEEAEVLVKKLWRMVIFFSESEKRGLLA